MAKRVFRSKVDWWIRALLVGAILGEALACGTAAIENDNPVMTTWIILASIAVAGLIVWIMLGTWYSVDRGVLKVVCGPIRWRVPLDEIKSVERTRSPLSSPALSLDRLLIRYGKRRRIMVSPDDKDGFLTAIGQSPGDAPGKSGGV